MTKKRFNKLVRAYFTRMNEWAKEGNSTPIKRMGELYRCLPNIDPKAVGKTRAEWWKSLTDGCSFGVGVKEATK